MLIIPVLPRNLEEWQLTEQKSYFLQAFLRPSPLSLWDVYLFIKTKICQYYWPKWWLLCAECSWRAKCAANLLEIFYLNPLFSNKTWIFLIFILGFCFIASIISHVIKIVYEIALLKVLEKCIVIAVIFPIVVLFENAELYYDMIISNGFL